MKIFKDESPSFSFTPLPSTFTNINHAAEDDQQLPNGKHEHYFHFVNHLRRYQRLHLPQGFHKHTISHKVWSLPGELFQFAPNNFGVRTHDEFLSAAREDSTLIYQGSSVDGERETTIRRIATIMAKQYRHELRSWWGARSHSSSSSSLLLRLKSYIISRSIDRALVRHISTSWFLLFAL